MSNVQQRKGTFEGEEGSPPLRWPAACVMYEFRFRARCREDGGAEVGALDMAEESFSFSLPQHPK